MVCKFKDCKRKRGLTDGYCKIHVGRGQLKPSTDDVALNEQSTTSKRVTNEDLKDLIHEKFDSLNAIIQQLQAENVELCNQVDELEGDVIKLTKENADLKSAVNKRYIAHDALNQHGRHVNARFLNIAESTSNVKEDCTEHVIAVAKKMNVIVTKNDIERCHRLGKPRENGSNRPIIVRFSSFRKKKELMQNKKALRIPEEEMKELNNDEKKAKLASNPFIVEDLTPFRGHIFSYVKKWNSTNKKFDVVTTDYGQIVVKEKDVDTWHRISSTEDFLKAGIAFDAKEFKDELL